jgi:hypothetical protein
MSEIIMTKAININDVHMGDYVTFVYNGKRRIGLVVPSASHVRTDEVICLHTIEKTEDSDMGEEKFKSFKKELIEALELIQ